MTCNGRKGICLLALALMLSFLFVSVSYGSQVGGENLTITNHLTISGKSIKGDGAQLTVEKGATLELIRGTLEDLTIIGEPGSTIKFSGGPIVLDKVVIDTKGRIGSQAAEIYFKNGSRINLLTSMDQAVFDRTRMDLSKNDSAVFLSIGEEREAEITKGSTVTGGNGAFDNGFISVSGKLKITDQTDIFENTNDQGNVIRVNDGGVLELDNVYVCDNESKAADGLGGVIGAVNASVTIKGSSIENNKSVYGGAIYLSGGSLQIENCHFIGNSSTEFGGAICIAGADSFSVNESSFSANESGHGGAIRMENISDVQITGTVFHENYVAEGASGGAIDGHQVSMTITGSEFHGNGSVKEKPEPGFGGAIAVYNSTLNLSDCILSHNTASYGGALLHSGGTLNIDDCTFGYNRGYWGGAVAVDGAYEKITDPPQNPVEPYEKMNVIISSSGFLQNVADGAGGALALGFEDAGRSAPKDVVRAAIGGSTAFYDNTVINSMLTEAGGAIYLHHDATLRMNRVRIVSNRAEGDGGAISNGSNGVTILNPRNGAMIDYNHADDTRQDLWMGSTANPHVISEQMFNGMPHNWDPPASQTVAERYTSNPSEEHLDSTGARVRIVGNAAYGHSTSPIVRGGGIGNNGILIIGDAETSIKITKYWDDDWALENGDKYSDLFRPDMEDFLKSLQVYRVDSESNRLPMLNWDNASFQVTGSGENASWRVTNVGILYEESGTSVDSAIYLEAIHDTVTDTDKVTVRGLLDLPDTGYEVEETLDNYSITEIRHEKIEKTKKLAGADAPGSRDYEIVAERHWEVNIYNKIATVDMVVTKVWDDDHNRDAVRPRSSEFEEAISVMYAYDSNGEEITGQVDLNRLNAEVCVTDHQDDTYTIRVVGLPKISPVGTDIRYTIREGEIRGYIPETDTAEPGGVIRNRHDIARTDITVRKRWNDAGHENARPESVTVRLHANGREVAVQQMTKADAWKEAVFTDLPVYEEGEPIIYTVTEDAVTDYTHHIDGENYIVTNTYNPGKTSVDVEKVWNDSHNRDGMRPRTVMVHLYADGRDTGRTLLLSEDTQWYGAFAELDEKKNGEVIVYTVRENPVEGYEIGITGDAKTGFILTNTHEVRTRNIIVQKIWDDAGHETARPDSITVRLHANGVEIAKRELTRENNWTPIVFENLPVYENGFGVVYTVTEDAVENYTHHIDEQADTITNTYNPDRISIDVEKVWLDGYNVRNTRPQSVTVHLYADGVNTGKTLTLTEAGMWVGTFEELDKHSGGHEIAYTIREDPVSGYSAHISGDRHVGYTITNSLTGRQEGGGGEFLDRNPYTHEFTFTKAWKGGAGDAIDWTLYRSDGTEARKMFNKTVISDSEWQYEAWFSRKDDYYIVEKVPAGYMVTYENTGAHSGVTDRCYNGGRIINYRIPRTGDTDRIVLWTGLSVLSLLGLALILRRRRRGR